MAITPLPGYQIDPSNPNGVVKIGSVPAAPTTPTPVPTTAPTGQTSTSNPVPTPVVSAQTAADHYNNTVVPAVNDASTASANAASIRAANKANAAAALIPADQANSNTFVTPQPKAPPAPVQTMSPADQAAADIAAQPDPGNQWVFDKTTGAKTQQPVNTPLTTNQTTTDIVNAPAVATAQTATTNIKQYADGTYGVFDATTGQYLGQANQQNFQDAQGQQKAKADLVSIQNGTYPLTADQQGTIDSITSYYNKLIDQQNTDNANLTGGTTVAQNLYGIGGTQIAIGAIQKTISDGALKIQQLNDEMNSKIAAAKAAIKSGNIEAVQAAYNDFTEGVNAKNTILKQMHDEAIQAVKDAQDEADKKAQILATKNDQIDNDIRSAIANATKNSATPDQLTAMKQALTNHDYSAAVSAAGDSLQEMSGDFADYPQYKKDMLARGLTPADPTIWLAQKKAQDAKDTTNEAYSTAYAAEKGRGAAANADGGYGGTTQKQQEALEQQARVLLKTEQSARGGTFQTNNAKVSQANKAAAALNSSYDPKTGNYNLTSMQYGGLLESAAALLSGSNAPTNAQLSELATKTGIGDFNKINTYLTGNTQNATSQSVIKGLVNLIATEQEASVKDRDQIKGQIEAQMPTDLDPKRAQQLLSGGALPATPIAGVAEGKITNFLKANGSQTIQMPDGPHSLWYAVPSMLDAKDPQGRPLGMTPEDVVQYLQQLGYQI